jgi:hypothetical protein
VSCFARVENVPKTLATYDSEATTILAHCDVLGVEQMLNRSDGVVTDVCIAGMRARKNSQPTAALGTQTMGRALTVRA